MGSALFKIIYVVGILQQRLGRNLRRLRVQRRMSQEAFAELLEVHRTYVGGLERGERNPSLRVVERLAEELEVDALSLLADDSAAVRPRVQAAADGAADDAPDARSLQRVPRPQPPD